MTQLWTKLVNFGFRLLYNELAFTYDLISLVVSLGAWRCWTRTSLKYIGSDSPVLELAHGPGNLHVDLSAAGYRCIGYDLSPTMGRIAQGKLRRHGLPIRLARGRAEQLPFPGESFAAVISTFPTDFILAAETIREVQRVLQPGGVLVIVPNSRLVGSGRLETAIEWLYKVTGQRGGTTDHDALAKLFAPLQIEVIEEHCPRSLVTVITARKML